MGCGRGRGEIVKDEKSYFLLCLLTNQVSFLILSLPPNRLKINHLFWCRSFLLNSWFVFRSFRFLENSRYTERRVRVLGWRRCGAGAMSGGGLARSYISGRGPGLGPEAHGHLPSPSHHPVGVSAFCR